MRPEQMMADLIQTPEIYLRIIRALSLLAPRHSRLEWSREWEAEIVSRWFLLKEWERLNARSKLDLLRRVQGAFWDVPGLQHSRTSLLLVVFNFLIALFTGFGALQQLAFDGLLKWHLQPFFLSLAAVIVSLLFMTSGIALLRRWPTSPRLITLTGTMSVLLHIYGVLPPHRNMGFFILIVGAGYGLLMMFVFRWSEKRKLVL